MSINKQKKIFVAGHRGMVGSAVLRRLELLGYSNVILRSRDKLDLLNQRATHSFLEDEKPDYVFMAAALVGGIHANNTYPGDFIYENLTVQNNIIHGAFKTGIQNLCFLGSSCIYPRDCSQPIKEEYLLTGPLEKTNEAYAAVFKNIDGFDFVRIVDSNTNKLHPYPAKIYVEGGLYFKVPQDMVGKLKLLKVLFFFLKFNNFF